jgi:hypothetical protein
MVQAVGSKTVSRAPVVAAPSAKPLAAAPAVTGVVNAISGGPAMKDHLAVCLIEGGDEHFKRGGRLTVVLVPRDSQTRARLPAGNTASFPAEALVEQPFRIVNGRPVPELDTEFDVDEILLQVQGFHSDPTLVQERRVRVFRFTGQLSDVQST